MLVVLRDLIGSCGQLARKEKNNFWSSFPTFKSMMKARHSQVEKMNGLNITEAARPQRAWLLWLFTE